LKHFALNKGPIVVSGRKEATYILYGIKDFNNDLINYSGDWIRAPQR